MQRAQEPPFGIMLLALSLALVQLAVALTHRQPLAYVQAAGDLVLGYGLWRLFPWARWLTLLRCLFPFGAVVFVAARGELAGISWPPLAVALFGLVYLWLPAVRAAFTGRGAQ
jgi:uncharacterized membrane protein (DUF2068 family)